MNSRTYNDMLTVIIVSFHSNLIIENLINVIEKDIKVLVIENSLDKKLKLNLEKKFENVDAKSIYNALKFIGKFLEKNILIPNNLNYPIFRKNLENFFR